MRGGLRLNRTLGLRGDSNHSAQRLGSTLGVSRIFACWKIPRPRLGAVAPTSLKRSEHSRFSAIAFCLFSILIFFAGGGFELECVAKKRGGLFFVKALKVDIDFIAKLNTNSLKAVE